MNEVIALDRRHLLGLGTAAAAGLALARPARAAAAAPAKTSLPTDRIGAILQAPAEEDKGIVTVGIGRGDIRDAHVPYRLNGEEIAVPFNAGFQLKGEFVFEGIGGGKAMMNADFCFLPEEVEPAIDAMLAAGLNVQSLHQHYMRLSPMMFFMHMRGTGDPLDLARAAHSVVAKTAAPLPQAKPNPATPLDKEAIGKLIGAKAKVEDEGVVSLVVPRTDRIMLAGRPVDPALNVSSNMTFQKLDNGKVAAAPDIAMTTKEIAPVLKLMRGKGWDVHCLYNQETGENPQLYFAHMLKVGDTEMLAREIREALDLTASKRA